MGFTVVGLGLIGVSVMYVLMTLGHSSATPTHRVELAMESLSGFGFGASAIALFARVAGGIYTKAADVGADLVGKVEAGVPEDDPRNPAVIADLVGDNVGDCAGQAADLFESIGAEMLSAMILGSDLAEKSGMTNDMATYFMMFPLALHCLDIIASTFGMWFVYTKPGLPQFNAGY